MNVKNMFPSGWLKAGDVPADITLTIGAIELEEVADEMKPVMRFTDHEKALVINRTNADVIAGLYGDNTNEWIGKKITVGAEPVKYKNQTMMGVRVRPFVSLGATGAYAPAVVFKDNTAAAIMLRLESHAKTLEPSARADGGSGLVAAYVAARDYAAGHGIDASSDARFVATSLSDNRRVYAAGLALLVAANGGVTDDGISF